MTTMAVDRRCGLLRSISSPSAILGAVAGLTCAVHAVVRSPSMARLGSPKPAAGRSYGLYVEAALVSSRMAACCDSLGAWPAVDSLGVEPLAPALDGCLLVLEGVGVAPGAVAGIFGAVADGFGTAAVSGILGGLTTPCGRTGLTVWGDVALDGGTGVVLAGGVTGAACATVVVSVRALGELCVSAA